MQIRFPLYRDIKHIIASPHIFSNYVGETGVLPPSALASLLRGFYRRESKSNGVQNKIFFISFT